MFGRMKKNTKGSVLYTVVAVMMIMTAFVCAALTLAASANRRAHVNYANNQTQYTARSVIDTVWSEIRRDSELSSKVFGKSGTVSLSIKGIDSSMGKVTKATVTKIGGENSKTYKLAVTVEMLGQESTIAGYYDVKQLDNRPNFAYSFVSLDQTNLSGINSFGGACLSIEPSDSPGSSITNGTSIDSPVHVNGNFSVNTEDAIRVYPNSGIFVGGDINIENENKIKSIILDSNVPLKYRSLPYVYAYQAYYGSYGGGVIRYADSDIKMGDSNNPILVIASSMRQNTANINPIYGDLYLYGKYETTVLGVNGVVPWTRDVLAKRMAGSSVPYTGGNVYSLGEISVDVQEGASCDVANNVRAAYLNIADKANLSTVNTTGMIVADRVHFGNKIKCNAPSGFFVDPGYFNHKKSDGTEARDIAINDVYYGKRGYEVDNPSYKKNEIDANCPPEVKNYKGGSVNTDGNYYWDLSDYTVWTENLGTAKFEKQPHTIKLEFGDYISEVSDLIDTGEKKYRLQDCVNITTVKVKWRASGEKLVLTGTEPGSWPPKPIKNEYNVFIKDAVLTGKLVADNLTVNFPSNIERNATYNFQEGYHEDTYTLKVPAYITDPNAYLELALTGGEAEYGNWNGMYWNKVGTMPPRQIYVEQITVTAERAVKTIEKGTAYNDYPDTDITFLKAANDVAFSKHNTATPGVDAIQIDDIDKSVRLYKTTQNIGGEIVERYSIYKCDFTSFSQSVVPYASCVVNVKEGEENNIKSEDYVRIGEYSGDTDDIDGVDNYKQFLKDVVKTVCYPETMGVTQDDRELFNAANCEKNMRREPIRYAEGDRPDPNHNYTGEVVKILAFRLENGANYWDQYKRNETENRFYCYTTDGDKIYDESNNQEVHLYYTNGEEVPPSFIERHPDIPVYKYIDDNYVNNRLKNPLYNVNRKTGEAEDMTVDIFNGMNGRAQYGMLSFVDDSPLYGNFVTSNIRNKAMTEINEAFTKHELETKRIIYDFGKDGSGNPAMRQLQSDESGNIIVPEELEKQAHDAGRELSDSEKEYIEQTKWQYNFDLTVTQSCTFTGNLVKTIKIIPTSDIYIRLENFSLGDGNKYTSNLYVDDSMGRVNFLVPKKQKLSINGDILTKYYYDQVYVFDESTNEYTNDTKNTAIQVPNNPAIKVNGEVNTDDEKIPDIYFYVQYDEDYNNVKKKNEKLNEKIEKITLGRAKTELEEEEKKAVEDIEKEISANKKLIENNIFEINTGQIVSAYILAPTSQIVSSTGKNMNISYYTDLVPSKYGEDSMIGTHKMLGDNALSDSTAIKGSDKTSANAVIGACIFGDASLNDGAFFVGYINPNPKDEEGKEMKSSIPKLQYYQAY